MKAISATDFLRLDDLKTDYIIPNLLPEVGRVALYGVAKRGKSFLALQLAFAVCQGIPFLGHEVFKPGPVLYLQFDTPPELWQERLRKLQNAGISIPDNLYFIHPSTQPRRVNVLDGHQAREIHDMITAKLPALVVIDVLSKIHHLNENEAQDMKPVIGHLSTLCQGRALLIVHHTAKPNLQPGAGQHSPSSAGRGSSYLGGEMDANWLLTSQGEGQGRLTIEARFAAPDKPIKLIQSLSGMWVEEVKHQESAATAAPKLAAALGFIHTNRERGYAECERLAIAIGITEITFKRAWKMDQDNKQVSSTAINNS